MTESSGSTSPPATPAKGRASLRRYLATSDERFPRLVRSWKWKLQWFSVPAPRVLVKPIAAIIVGVRSLYHGALRIFLCEPFFKAHCKKYGPGLHTGCFLHWIQGKGDIVLGDNVIFDGKCDIVFAARFSDAPILDVGDNSAIAHGCRLVIGRRISIGARTTVSGGCIIMDSNGHPTDPVARQLRKPPSEEDVRPVTIGNDVWIGMECLIFPGVKIGDGSVISAGSVVRTHVPPFSVVAGNPAKVMFRLKKPEPSGKA
jgi:acetyltransferase-like isoleucine patch superfamily enzyme